MFWSSPSSGFFYIICILFFVLTVTPAWNQVIPTGMGVRGHFAWRVSLQDAAVHTYFAFTTAKLNETLTTEALWVT